MKYGSIAIINQIRVVSKQRIYNPKTEFDILSGIKLSNENLNLIDYKMKKMWLNKFKNFTKDVEKSGNI